jgi:hypothetical protein
MNLLTIFLIILADNLLQFIGLPAETYVLFYLKIMNISVPFHVLSEISEPYGIF